MRVLDPVERRLAKAASVADLRRQAARRLPRGVFDYIDGGAEDERTLAANVYAFARRPFQPRVLRDVGDVDTSTTLLGRPVPLPLVLARQPGSPASPTPTASWPSAAPPPRLGCRIRSRPSRPARSRRSPRPVTARSGSRSTSGETARLGSAPGDSVDGGCAGLLGGHPPRGRCRWRRRAPDRSGTAARGQVRRAHHRRRATSAGITARAESTAPAGPDSFATADGEAGALGTGAIDQQALTRSLTDWISAAAE